MEPEQINGLVDRDRGLEVLRERAEKLARKVSDAALDDLGGDGRDYVVFSMGGEFYGIETNCITEVREQVDILSVPCTPDFLKGVISIRGQVWAVYDFCLFLGRGTSGAGKNRVLLLTDGERELGLLVDEIREVVSIPGRDSMPLSEGMSVFAAYASGVTAERVVLLKGKELLEEPAFVISEFVEGI